MDYQIQARLFLSGPARLETAGGVQVEISSKKAMALLALLATAERFERSRVWLQQMLWGSRAQKQAQSSLRRELSNLKGLLEHHNLQVLDSTSRVVRIIAEKVQVDVLQPDFDPTASDFLEGIDLAGEESFEDWLRERRANIGSGIASTAAAAPYTAAIAAHTELKAQIAVMQTAVMGQAAGATELAWRTDQFLTDYLARQRWLPVVAAPQNEPANLARHSSESVSDTLGVRYLARSEIIDNGNDRAINFTLLEMPGRIIRWSETRNFAAIPSERELSMEIARAVNCLSINFDICEQRHMTAGDTGPQNDLSRLTWQIRFHLEQFTLESFAQAEKLIEDALAQYPSLSELMMLRANLALWQYWTRRSDPGTASHIAPLIRIAMRADPSDARGPLFQGILDIWSLRTTSAQQHLARSCELNPSSNKAFTHLGASYYLQGDPEAALEPLKHALFLAPLDATRFFPLGEMATTLWMLERYDEALEIALEIQATHPGYVLAHVIETACHAASGRFNEAARARAKLLDAKPHLYHAMLDWIPFHDRSWPEKLRASVEFDLQGGPQLRSARCR